MSERKLIRRALVSVYDKARLIEIGKVLSDAGVEILSTGSTAKNLAGAGIKVTEVSEYTGFPEIMGGRVKTLHPRVHSGILADQSNPEHLLAIAELDIAPFDLVIINLYPFAETIASGADFAESIEQIDIGGPSMLRGAARVAGPVGMGMNMYDAGQMARETQLGERLAQGQGQQAEQAFRQGPVQSYQGPQLAPQEAQNVMQNASPRDRQYFNDQLTMAIRLKAAKKVLGQP